MMSDKKIEIKERFSQEISNIDYILTNLKNGRIKELTGYNQDGYLATNVQKLRKELNDLLNKIQNDKPSALEEMGDAFNTKL
jgi:hypothetical protein